MKRDGAVAKVMSQIIQDNSDSSERTISRASKKQACAKAEMEVTKCVKKREEELKQLIKANPAMAFLTTGGMVGWLSAVENRWLDYIQTWQKLQKGRLQHVQI